MLHRRATTGSRRRAVDPYDDRVPAGAAAPAAQQDGRMTRRQLVSSGAGWEPVVGCSRAVRVGQWVAVAGTTAAADGGGAVGGDDIAEQALVEIEVDAVVP